MSSHWRAAGMAALLYSGSTAVTSCGPCDLIAACRQSPVVAVVGQTLDRGSGVGVRDVSVTARFTGGDVAPGVPIETRTRADGYFELVAPVEALGMSVLEITVAAPGRRPYVVPAARVTGQLTAGNAVVLAPWVAAEPEIPFALSVRRQTEGPVGAAEVTFERTGGRRLYLGDHSVDRIQGITGDDGIIFLFVGVSTDTIGDVFGDLIVRESGRAPDTLLNISVASTPRFRATYTLIGALIP